MDSSNSGNTGMPSVHDITTSGTEGGRMSDVNTGTYGSGTNSGMGMSSTGGNYDNTTGTGMGMSSNRGYDNTTGMAGGMNPTRDYDNSTGAGTTADYGAGVPAPGAVGHHHHHHHGQQREGEYATGAGMGTGMSTGNYDNTSNMTSQRDDRHVLDPTPNPKAEPGFVTTVDASSDQVPPTSSVGSKNAPGAPGKIGEAAMGGMGFGGSTVERPKEDQGIGEKIVNFLGI